MIKAMALVAFVTVGFSMAAQAFAEEHPAVKSRVHMFEATAAPMQLENGVHVRKVSFSNRHIVVVGNLFAPPNYDAGKKYAAIVVTHPGGGVKEQTSGLYAQLLAEKGFITLAYDASFHGESGGEPRLIEDPATRVEDIKAATDFLLNYPSVKVVGALGVCAGGGYTIHAAETEARLKAVAAVSAVDSGRTRREGIGGIMSDETRNKTLEEVGNRRTIEAGGGEVRYIGYVFDSMDAIPEGSTPMLAEAYEYYRTPRGSHPRSTNRYRFTSLDKMFAYTAFDHVDWISPRPLLPIAGNVADTLYLSQDAYNMAKEPKELFLIDGASHFDLYDKEEYVPAVVDKLASFFDENLN